MKYYRFKWWKITNLDSTIIHEFIHALGPTNFYLMLWVNLKWLCTYKQKIHYYYIALQKHPRNHKLGLRNSVQISYTYVKLTFSYLTVHNGNTGYWILSPGILVTTMFSRILDLRIHDFFHKIFSFLFNKILGRILLLRSKICLFLPKKTLS